MGERPPVELPEKTLRSGGKNVNPMHDRKPIIRPDETPFPPIVNNHSPVNKGKVRIPGGTRTIPAPGAQ